MITLLAMGIYAASTVPAILLGCRASGRTAGPKGSMMVASNGLRALLALAIPVALLPRSRTALESAGGSGLWC